MQGALDFYSFREAKQMLLDELELRPRRLVIDVSEAFVDSCGIGVLVHVAQRLSMERGQFRLVCTRQFGVFLQSHGLTALMRVAATVEDGLERTVAQTGSLRKVA